MRICPGGLNSARRQANKFKVLGVRLMSTVPTAPNDLLTPAEVAALLYVDPKTVSRWAMAGKIRSIRTPGGHRRFLRSEIVAMIAGGDADLPVNPQPMIVVTSPVAPRAEPGRDEPTGLDRVAA